VTVQAVRECRGTNDQVRDLSTDELMNLLVQAINTTDQVARFIESVQAELIERGEIPTDPCVA
jgi:hypothetical protein